MQGFSAFLILKTQRPKVDVFGRRKTRAALRCKVPPPYFAGQLKSIAFSVRSFSNSALLMIQTDPLGL